MTGYSVWPYTVQPSDPGDILVGQTVALGLPGGIDVRNPQLFPAEAALSGTFVEQDASSTRQLVGRVVTIAGTQTISFVAPSGDATAEVMLFEHAAGQKWQTTAFARPPAARSTVTQSLTGPSAGAAGVTAPPVFNGRPVADFTGTLPYASELFGVYQPLAGWLGRQSVQRVLGGDRVSDVDSVAQIAARQPAELIDGALPGPAVAARVPPGTRPDHGVHGAERGLALARRSINLFRQYFFEFDNFLGNPSGHIWISPGGTVEVIETSTRRTSSSRPRSSPRPRTARSRRA